MLLVCLALVLTGCGCDHELYWTVTKEPVEGAAGIREQLCSVCGETVTTEEYNLSATHDGTNFTLTVDEYCSRLNHILQEIRSGLSCRIEANKNGEPTIYVFWNEGGYVTAIIPKTADEKNLKDVSEYPSQLSNLMSLNTTQQTKEENPVPVFELQIDSLQAMIMACDPQITGTEARQIVTAFLESDEQYVFENHGTLRYYFFFSNLGQPLLNLTLFPAE